MIDSLSQAANYVSRIFWKNGREIILEKSLNKGRHALLQTDKEVVYILFKRHKFMTYGKQFKGEDGIGESINIEYLNSILRSKKLDLILIVYPNNDIYFIDKQEWRDYSDKHGTVRMQQKGETTSSIPVGLLKRWDIVMWNRKLTEFEKPVVPNSVEPKLKWWEKILGKRNRISLKDKLIDLFLTLRGK